MQKSILFLLALLAMTACSSPPDFRSTRELDGLKGKVKSYTRTTYLLGEAGETPVQEEEKQYSPEGFVTFSRQKSLERDRIIEVKYEFDANGLPSGAMRTDLSSKSKIWMEISFDPKKRTSTILQFEGGKDGEKGMQLEREYDEEGWIVVDKFQGPSGALVQEIRSIRNEAGLLIREEVYWGDKQEPTQVSKFEYKEDGFLTHRSVKNTPGATEAASFENTADEQGNWVRQTNLQDGVPYTIDKRTFTYY